MGWSLYRWCLAGLLGCVAVAPAKGLCAEPSAPSAPSEEERAADLRKRAYDALASKQYSESVQLFRALWKLKKDRIDHVDLCKLGHIEGALGWAREAAESISQCLKVFPEPTDPKSADRRQMLEQMLKEAHARVGTLTIKGNVPGAEVLLDGEVVGKLPLEQPIFVEPGWRSVEVRAPGYKTDAKVFELRAGAVREWDVKLEPVPVAVVPALGDAALLKDPEPPLKPKVEFMKPPISPLKPSVAEAPQSRVLLNTGLVLAGLGSAVGVGGFVGATVLHGEADALNKEAFRVSGLERPCTAPLHQSLCDEIASTRSTARVLTAMGIGGVLVAVGGGVLILYDLVDPGSSREPKTTKKASVSVAVTGVSGGGSLWIRGRF